MAAGASGEVNGIPGVQVAGHDKCGVRVGPLVPADCLQGGGELPHFPERRLRPSVGVGEPEVQFESMVPVRVLSGEVEVGVVPRDPAGCAREQGVVQHVPVVCGGVRVVGEVRANAELLHDYRLAEGAGQLAGQRGGIVLPYRVVADRVDVRAEEVGELGDLCQPEPVVVAGDLDAPGAVTQGERLVAAGGAYRVPDELRPAGRLSRG